MLALQKNRRKSKERQALKNSQDCHPIVSRLLYQPLKSPETNERNKKGTSNVTDKLKS